MTRRYGHAISVTATGSRLMGFQWNGMSYCVVEVLATWHLRDRWWEAQQEADADPAALASDRHYHRVRCASGLICDVYHDMVSNAWVLDRVYD